MKDYLLYLVYRAFAALVPLLPRRLMVRTGRRLGGLYCRFSPRCRRAGMENLAVAFPEKSRGERKRILLDAMGQMGVSLLDALWSAKLETEDARKLVDVDPERLRWFKDRAAEGRGVVVATAHFGGWEMFNLAAPALGFPPATFIAREVRNKYVDRHFRRQRERTGNRLVYREAALHACVGALRRGEVVCSVIDMAIIPKHGGLFVDFFGLPATTTGALGLLALRRRAALLFSVCRPIDGGLRYVIEAEEIEVDYVAEDRDAEIERLTQEMSLALERKIREHPQNWIWDYRRWQWRPGEWPGPYPSYSLWVTEHL